METLDSPSQGFCPEAQGAAARADMYRFLSSVYLCPPQPRLLEYVSNGDPLSQLGLLLSRAGKVPCETDGGTLPICADPATLQQEYMDLFAVPAGRYVFPFEDVYRGTRVYGAEGKGPLLGSCAVAVMKRYQEAGAQIDPAVRELPTHVGIEISFMSFLCTKETNSYSEEGRDNFPIGTMPGCERLIRLRRLQLAFLTEHLNEWFPLLRASIEANAASEFYRALAKLTEKFLLWDTAQLVDALAGQQVLS